MSDDDFARLGAERIQRLAVIARELVSELRTDEVLDHLLATARELTGARYAALGVLDEQRTALARFVTSGVDDDTRRLIGDPPRGRGVLGLLIEDPEPLRLHDVASHPRSFGVPTGHPPVSTFLGVPLVVRGKAWGNLYLTNKAGGADFTDRDEETAVILARWAAIAIENARLYETLDAEHEELARSVASLRAMTEISTALGAETELAPILDLIVKRARALVAARGVLVLLRDPGGEDDQLWVAAAAGAIVPAAQRLAISGTRVGEVFRDGVPLRVDDVAADLALDVAALGAPDAATALLVPMAYRRRVVGVLVALDRRGGTAAFRARDEELLRAFAASAATAVVTAQSVEVDRLRVAVGAADAERARWARELHDETLQTLGGLHVLLAGAAHGGDGDQVRAAVRIAAERVADEIAALRALIAELRPAALDELGLGPALTSLVRRVAGGEGLTAIADVELDTNGTRLSPDLETAVYRVAQEALTNVAKHARADRVELHVTKDDDAVALSVVDDGGGFDVAAAAVAETAAPGFGLAGMRERVMLAGGGLTIDSASDGTTVSAWFPVGGGGGAGAGGQPAAPSATSSSRPRSSA
ncbi:Oxygen sensor histidine kinase response regulator DosT [Baekduia alba]|uniref:sensor histidine kinase n=1 Tax=Baekduia alba TaxID=2997333 RepID=UPI00233FCE25|nr:GAF domain-containing protein [Baekduia alba]WCB96421.1 Oxygen sensor histidine kinase response regulator DosT [Baekduia alba]